MNLNEEINEKCREHFLKSYQGMQVYASKINYFRYSFFYRLFDAY